MAAAPFTRWICCALACCFLTNALVAQTPEPKRKKRHAESQEDADAETTPAPDAETEQPAGKRPVAPDATIPADQIVEFDGDLPRVKKLIQSALALTAQNLTYTEASDDPANGGMDCSGFTSYVLKENGFSDVPRDASSQYLWLRKAGTFRAVMSQNPETFELDELRPGDVLFWIGTYNTSHDPPVTHAMLYLGTEKGTKQRIMAGSSDGRSYHGKPRWGVSVFDFTLGGSPAQPGGKPNRSMFIGYGRPPGLRD